MFFILNIYVLPRRRICDYTLETLRQNNFTKWVVMGKFPWVFGLFEGYQSQNEIRDPYDVSNERIKLAKDDPMCKGFILWPELSHGDSFMLEYTTANAWNNETPSIAEQTKKYCHDRYPDEIAASFERMKSVSKYSYNWLTIVLKRLPRSIKFLKLSKLADAGESSTQSPLCAT